MANRRLRVGLDANVLIAGVRLPRWPYEIMRAAIKGPFDLVLPEQVIIEARRHLRHPARIAALEAFLAGSGYEELPMPSAKLVRRNHDLVRSKKDIPIALSLLEGGADVFVSNDRDFTDTGATADHFQQQVRVMLAAVFLKNVLGWSSEALEAIRDRTWEDIETEP